MRKIGKKVKDEGGGWPQHPCIMSVSELSLAMYIGERMSAQDAKKCGLVSKVFPADELVNEAIKLGEEISSMSKVAIAMAKEAVDAADNLPLNEGQN